ncbi:sodium:solute symporter family protein [Piscinibacter gummiphilus]|uniref:Sodium:solute symporter n=1 Tax=Piscinibacter gummiphilus TaxID=946333 RepID=A0A1W6L333_9BURK|nr:sodium:solute symporter [Piscinibacter gummiphilus]ARN18705.1 sodium:solute symporter [Piscinibacter gummiphilus]ATU63343.1 sodium:solute symporter [Piscinibacter gummiphilus]GLS95853.1 putative symporter YhjB [Piscinibacter gummiphilus]
MNAAAAVIALTLLLSVGVGLRARRGAAMNLEQWGVGGRGFPAVLVFVLMAGELYTTFTFLGASGFAYGHGGAAFYIIVYTCLAFAMSYWLLPPIWRFARQHGAITQPEVFAKAYGSPALGWLVAVVALVALVPYLIVQFKGLGLIVQLTSYGALTPATAVWLGAAAMTLHVTLSGMHGSAVTAVVKDVLVLAVCVFLGLYLPFHHHGGLTPMFERIEAVRPGFLALPETGQNRVWFASTVVLSSLGMYLWPHAFSATFTAKSERSFRKNAMVMPLYALVMLFSMFAGFAAVLQVPGLAGGQVDLALLKLSIQTFDPWFVGVIGAAGMLTALVPGSIMLISAATLLVRNLYLPLRPGSSDAHLGRVSRIAAPLLTLLAVSLTLHGGSSIVSLLIMGFSIVTQLAPSLLAALIGRPRVNRFGAMAGILTGVGMVASTVLSGATTKTLLPFAPGWVHDLNVGVVGLALNVAVMLGVSRATRARGAGAAMRGVPVRSPA